MEAAEGEKQAPSANKSAQTNTASELAQQGWAWVSWTSWRGGAGRGRRRGLTPHGTSCPRNNTVRVTADLHHEGLHVAS